jgi:hypothetical protein
LYNTFENDDLICKSLKMFSLSQEQRHCLGITSNTFLVKNFSKIFKFHTEIGRTRSLRIDMSFSKAHTLTISYFNCYFKKIIYRARLGPDLAYFCVLKIVACYLLFSFLSLLFYLISHLISTNGSHPQQYQTKNKEKNQQHSTSNNIFSIQLLNLCKKKKKYN